MTHIKQADPNFTEDDARALGKSHGEMAADQIADYGNAEVALDAYSQNITDTMSIDHGITDTRLYEIAYDACDEAFTKATGKDQFDKWREEHRAVSAEWLLEQLVMQRKVTIKDLDALD